MQFQICDHLKYPVLLSIFGNTATVLALVLLGVPLIKDEDVCNSDVSVFPFFAGPLVGMGFSFVVVSTFSRICALTLSEKCDRNIRAYLVISGKNSQFVIKIMIQSSFLKILGVWSCFYTFGAFVAPALAGFLFENYGYSSTLVCFISIISIMISTDLFELIMGICERECTVKDEERQHILGK